MKIKLTEENNMPVLSIFKNWMKFIETGKPASTIVTEAYIDHLIKNNIIQKDSEEEKELIKHLGQPFIITLVQ